MGESPLLVGSATPRATSTSSPPTLDNGALFAPTASLPMTPTLSANNLGFPEREFYGTAAGSTAGGNHFGAVPSPFRILSGIEPVPVVMGSTGVGCAAPATPLVPLQRCANFADATNLGASPPPACPSNEVAGVECAP